MELISFNGKLVINNLCPECNSKRLAGELNESGTIIYNLSGDHKLLACIHPGDCSVLDLGTCPCGSIGFLETVENQFGLAKERNDILFDLDVVTEGSERGTYCTKCLPVTCEKCGKATRLSTKVDTEVGVITVCSDCATNYNQCSICHNCHTNNLYRPSGDYICRSCLPTVTQCPSCGYTVRSTDIRMYGDTQVCNNCSQIGTCVVCDTENVVVAYKSNVLVCHEHQDVVKDLPEIMDYSHTHARNFFTVKGESTNIFFGIENEVQLDVDETNFKKLDFKKRLLAKICLAAFPTMETKRDGSLGTYIKGHGEVNDGVECVWQPMSYRYIMKQRDVIREMFDKIQPMLRDDMAAAGMHIHVNRDAFTPLTFAKFTDFFYNRDFQPLLFSIAGRRYNEYAQLRQRFTGGTGYSTRSFAKALAVQTFCKKTRANICPDRYDVVNTTNRATHEIRIFKGANNYHDFMMRVEFMAALIAFVQITAIRYTTTDFINFIAANVKLYPELYKHTSTFNVPSNFEYVDGAEGVDDSDSDPDYYDSDDDF